MAILAALLGSWGRRGGYLTPGEVRARRLPAARRTSRTTAAPRRKCDRAEGRRLPARDGGARERPVRRDEAGPRALRPQGLDRLRLQPVQAMPARHELDRDDPAPRLHGRGGRPARRDRRLGRRGPARRRPTSSATTTSPRPRTSARSSRSGRRRSPPLHDSRPGWWIAKELANRVGLGAWFPWKDAKEYVRTRAREEGALVRGARREGRAARRAGRDLRGGGRCRSAPPPRTARSSCTRRSSQALGFDPLPVYRAAGRRPAGLVPAPVGPRPAPHLRPDHEQPAARGAVPGERGVAQRRRGAVAARASRCRRS